MKSLSYESWVSQFVEKLMGHMNLQGWVIQVGFSGKPDDSTYASIRVNSAYQHADLTVYPLAKEDFETRNFKRMVMGLVHELTHIFLDPFQDFIHPHLSITTAPMFEDILENQTQKLTMVLLKSLPKNIIPPFPARRILKNGKHDSTPKDHKSRPAVRPARSFNVRGKRS